MRARILSEVCDSHISIPDAALAPDRDAGPTEQVGTAHWRPKDRFKLWADYVRRHSDALVMPNTPLHDYRIAATLQERGEVTINQAISDPIGFVRTPRHAANLRADRVRISYCRRVDGGIESGGKAARIADGAVYFRDYRGPGRSWAHSVFEETWLFVPREWLVEGGKAVREFDGAVFQSDHVLAGLMAQRIEAVATHADDAAAFAEAVRGLRATVEDVFAARSSDSHRKMLQVKAERLRRVKAYLTQHAGDSDLTPDRIADVLGMARSSLYRLLQEEGLQVSAHVAEYRLASIAKTLRDPAWIERPIGEIAALWGHFDQAYLTRVFKRRFGETPSRYRLLGTIDTARAHP